MRISKLDLFGFKSFPDRTAMQFGKGISCVVGPNGSGKSNVVDALKWVIGEQSARSLRGAEMSDVIFAGSTERKPVGFAEVALTLDVDGGAPFPGEYAKLQEIQVGRRLHRSGASEYLINQVKCRRKDVVDLFLDTGIGTNLYSFIEQGRVDKVVSATPNERRGLIDEAAGISRYKARREEARSRLEATVQQLDRAADVADEMGRRLKVLERQVVKAARFRQARARVRQREVFLSLVKYRGLAADRRALQQGLREARSEEAAARRGLARREEDLRVRREELESVDDAARAWRDELAEVDARLRELASQKSLQGQRASEATEQVTVATAERGQIADELAQAVAQQEEVAGRLEEVDRALAADGVTTAEREAHRQASAAAVATAAAQRQRAEATWQQHQADQVRLTAERAAVEERRDAVPGLVVKLEVQSAELDEEGVASTAALEVAEEQLAAARAVEAESVAALERAEHHLAELDGRREQEQAAHEARRTQALEALSAARTNLDDHRAEERRRRIEQERAREEAVAEARRNRDRQVGAVRQRADAWVDGVASEARRREARARSRLDEAVERWRQLEAEGRVDAQREGEEFAAQTLVAAEQQVRQVLQPLEQSVRKGRDRLETARHDVETARVALAEAEARVAACTASLRATDRPAALADATPVMDRGTPEDGEAALRRWGRRATLPALQEPEAIASALDALGDGEAAEVFWWRPGGAPEVAERHDVVSALQTFAQEGGAVQFPGGRIEGDGVVSVGLHDVAAARLATRKALEEAEADAERSGETLREGQGQLALAEEGLERALEVLEEARREGDRAAAEARSSMLDRTREHVERAVSELLLERDTVLDGLRDRVVGSQRDGEAAVAMVRDRREELLEAVVAEIDMALDAALASLPSAEEEERSSEAELLAEVDRAEAALKACSATLSLPERTGPMAAVSSARSERERAGQRRGELEGNAARATQHQEGWRRRRQELVGRLEEARAESERWARRVEELGEAAAALEGSRAEVEATRADAVQAHDVAVAAHQEMLVSTQSAEAARSALVERRDAHRDRAEELGARVLSLRARDGAVESRRVSAEARCREATEAARAAGAEHELLQVQRGSVYDKLQRERTRHGELSQGIRAAEADLGTLRTRLEEATRSTQELVDRSATVRGEIEHLRERMDDRYQVGIPGMLDRIERAGKVVLEADGHVAQGVRVGATEVEGVTPFEVRRASLDDETMVRDAVETLEEERRRLASFGEVHLGALEEYTELADRHEDLEAQRADLDGSVSQLRTAIAKMNRTCRERFREAFDQVNENFQLSYPKLLGGGSARLALTDHEDLLETGVDIFVQPPGKRLQHLQLLSGGEKAMTAIALLIALFRVKPSPFCVLDEVDAPLDERNGGRFNTMLRELAETSQFVVITHNRKTMECADTLYGISMTNPGVSNLVTVSLAEAPV